MRYGRQVTPLVGTAMAAVAAGSLVLFSLLAERTALEDSQGGALRPRAPVHGDAPHHVTIGAAPGDPDEGSRTPGGTLFVSPLRTTVVAPAAQIIRNRSLLASASLDIERLEVAEASGPIVPISPPAVAQTPDEPNEHAGCPGSPTKPHAKKTHPHGRPPACGNPHGRPPGEVRRAEATAPQSRHAKSGGTPPADGRASGRSRGRGESPPPADRPGGRPSRPPQSQPGRDAAPEDPHGGPPGQTKEPDETPGHARGGGTGRSKKG